MRPSRKLLRRTATVVLLFLFTLVVIPVVSEFFIELAREEGLYDNPSHKAEWVMTTLSGIVETWWFACAFGFLAGGTVFMWADHFLRRSVGTPFKGALGKNQQPSSQDRAKVRANTKVDAIRLNFEARQTPLQFDIEAGAPVARVEVCIANEGDGYLSSVQLAVSSIRPNPRWAFPQRLADVNSHLFVGREQWIELLEIRLADKGRGRIRVNLPNYGTADFDPFIPLQDCWIAVEATADQARKVELILKLTIRDGSAVSVERWLG